MIYFNEERREFIVFFDEIELEFVFVIVDGKFLFCVDILFDLVSSDFSSWEVCFF